MILKALYAVGNSITNFLLRLHTHRHGNADLKLKYTKIPVEITIDNFEPVNGYEIYGVIVPCWVNLWRRTTISYYGLYTVVNGTEYPVEKHTYHFTVFGKAILDQKEVYYDSSNKKKSYCRYYNDGKIRTEANWDFNGIGKMTIHSKQGFIKFAADIKNGDYHGFLFHYRELTSSDWEFYENGNDITEQVKFEINDPVNITDAEVAYLRLKYLD